MARWDHIFARSAHILVHAVLCSLENCLEAVLVVVEQNLRFPEVVFCSVYLGYVERGPSSLPSFCGRHTQQWLCSFLCHLLLSLQDAKEPPAKSWSSLLKGKEDIPEVSVRLSPTQQDTDLTAPSIPYKHIALMVSSHFSSTILGASLLPEHWPSTHFTAVEVGLEWLGQICKLKLESSRAC